MLKRPDCSDIFMELSTVFSLIVNEFYISQHLNFYVQVYEVHFTIWQLNQSDLHFFETQNYVQLLKQININYIVTNEQKIRAEKKLKNKYQVGNQHMTMQFRQFGENKLKQNLGFIF